MSLTKTIERLRDLEKKSTDSPWFVDGEDVRFDCSPQTTDSGVADCTIEICKVFRLTEKLDDLFYDRQLIAESRNIIPKLLDALEKMRKALLTISDMDVYDLEMHASNFSDTVLKEIDAMFSEEDEEGK